MKTTIIAAAVAVAFLAACGPPQGVPAREVLENIDQYKGKMVRIRTKLRSGARCRQGEDGEWKTYCKDCVYCRGPLVIDLETPLATRTSTGGTTHTASTAALGTTDTSSTAHLDDWPMILGGTIGFEDIRCKGPLNAVVCAPMQEGKTYVIQGVIEYQRPPKLLVERFWPVEGG